MRLFTLLSLLLFVLTASAQKVTVSNEVNVRSDRAYDILGNVGPNILLYRDRDNERFVEVFDNDLRYLYSKNVNLGGKRSYVQTLVKRDSSFLVFYSRREEDFNRIYLQEYNHQVQPLDTVMLLEADPGININRMTFAVSEDKSKTLLFAFRKATSMFMVVIDNDTKEMLWWKEILIGKFNLLEDFRKILLTNAGEVNLVLETNNDKFDLDEHYFTVYGVDGGEGYFSNRILLKDYFNIDFEANYDEVNKNIVMAGLCANDSEVNATHYFYFVEKLAMLEDTSRFNIRPFTQDFYEELYGKKLGKRKRLENFVVSDLILRRDGGFILVNEMFKEYYRRSSFNNRPTVNREFFGGGQGWVDYYHEDLIAIAVYPDGEEHWKKILYKKQFSQDDNGIFSSFYTFKTPRRLRLLYNDEIKSNNTVSEYVLNPIGEYERNSVLSTEYQNLRLRFRDAVQISANKVLVPSEKNFKLSLVLIDYGK